MSVILLADDSPHAQRMGDRILREEGYQVMCAADGETAALRLAERRSGCRDRGYVFLPGLQRLGAVPLRQDQLAATCA